MWVYIVSILTNCCQLQLHPISKCASEALGPVYGELFLWPTVSDNCRWWAGVMLPCIGLFIFNWF